ncbi:unnamed protein product [Danaus chrysippus]|uniref:(African queen) hypothetical protein n=1 Tax=Danaus chrysippus TaxID=151541 RepID=A0A8J2QKZ5_9NEOP|nr:unnamed protein product [Danaus chrysippus]
MEHIRQFDWCYSQPDIYFVKEEDLAHSVTEKILRNKFHDPLISSDSEDEKVNVDWDQVFNKTQSLEKVHRIFVPCLTALPQYLKKSALTEQQHYQCIKVLCSQNLHVLEQEFIPRPTKSDYKVFEELKPIYEQEQKEYREWAKTLWATTHCVRALRPKPILEAVYEALIKLKAHEMQCYPKTYSLAAQIPLDYKNDSFEMVLEEDLINVDLSSLPKIDKIDLSKKFVVMKLHPLPEPCNKHICRFILPNEKTMTMLPLWSVQAELAQYCVERGAVCMASEEALGCLVELDRPWDLALAVHQVIDPDGEPVNILILGDEFVVNKESPLTRTYKAFKYLLEQELISASEKLKQNVENEDISDENTNDIDLDGSSDDEGNRLCIDDTKMDITNEQTQDAEKEDSKNGNEMPSGRLDADDNDFDMDKCTCKGTMFEKPPPRSFRKWRITNRSNNESYSVIVHCEHRLRDKQSELIVEPTPEYQIELGAAAVSQARLRRLALAARLRRNAAFMHVRLNAGTGEVATVERLSAHQFVYRHGSCDVIGHVHAALTQLQGLRPGRYVLRHEPSHGSNALLLSAGDGTGLQCPRGEEDALTLRIPPTITTDLLPYHKFRRILPCAFTPHERQVQRPPARTLARNKTPPRALQWPKKKKKKKPKN